ncbi:hypothetical protein INT48_003834 [Thamnidium elegans]|uniref:Nucleoporin-domain-containing protein n=1 Tax=Thamnidium elegans TaxID=101142 RepID=A0A8H7SFP5_9FUNG|nr:hypothetical protein INT48_003834 [Thamnidium elegans]
MQSSTSASNNNTSDADFLANAGKAIEKVITLEKTYVDLGDVLTGATSDTYIKPLLSPDEEFVETNTVPIPPSILSQMEGIQCRCFMGLFPEIGRAWLTIDHRLFIWSYTNPREIFEYKDQDQIISSVGIAKPKRDIFSNQISYLLVFATPLQVIALGLSTESNKLTVFATDMNVSADDVQMTSITGTEDGRFFMIGNDSNVYEFIYNHPDNWFGDSTTNIKSLAIDNERKVLYLLGSSSIEAIYIGDKSNNYKPIAKNTTIIETAIQMCRQHSRMYNSDAFELESLHVISEAESKRIHLMAMTSAGFRLYFSLFRDGFRNTMIGMTTSNIPNALEFGHIRIPPINESAPQTNVLVRGTYYDCGICLSIKTKNDEIDSLVVTAAASSLVPTPQQNTYPNFISSRPVYYESVDIVDTKAKALTLAESRSELRGKRAMKELSQQLSEPPRQFMVLTTRWIVFYNKLRPVDVLFKLLIKKNRVAADEQKEFQAFFDRYGQTESCAMCLSIICNMDSNEVVAKATKVFFDFGGVPTSANTAQIPGNHLGQVSGQTGVNFSGKHDGFLLYFARMVTPIWKLKVFANCDSRNPNTTVLYAKSQTLLYETRCNLESLKRFMANNPRFHDCANILDPRFQATDPKRLELDLSEQKSVRELYLLLSQCNDVVYFIEFLLDSSLQNILINDGLQEAYVRDLLDLDVDTMLTTPSGRELSRELVIATIGKYAASDSHTNFDIVSNQLNNNCNSYFTPDDIQFFKGMEYLRRALCSEADYERNVSISKSLEYFKMAAGAISVKKMSGICNTYLVYAFHVGIVELALERAQKVDPQNFGFSAFESPHNSDSVKNSLLQSRLESYDFALQALDDAYRLAYQPIPAERTTIEDPNVHFRMVIDTALGSKDELFHFKLYEWFMRNNLENELMSSNASFLVTYFQKYVDNEKNSFNFLWRYYRNRGEFAMAAEYLYKLASSTTSDIDLSERTHYLTFAKINILAAASDQSSPTHYIANLNAVLEESIKVAQLQSRVQSILRSAQGVDAQVAADKLNTQLFTKQELWDQYGSQFQVLTP